MPTTFEFTDIAGIVKGASKGEGLGNKFLSHIREVDAICQVVRCFADDNITHVSGKVDPIADIETINLELILADLETVEKRIGRVEKMAKQKDKDAIFEFEILSMLKDAFESEKPARAVEFTDEQMKVVKGLHLLTIKPVLYVANVGEEDVADPSSNEYVQKVKNMQRKIMLKWLSSVQKLNRRLLSLTVKKKPCFYKNLELKNPVLIN